MARIGVVAILGKVGNCSSRINTAIITSETLAQSPDNFSRRYFVNALYGRQQIKLRTGISEYTFHPGNLQVG